MLGSSKESSNMQSLNFTTPCNRLALLVNPKPQQPIKYFPVFTWNRVGNRTSAEASNSRQLVWLNVVQEQEGGGSVRGGAGHIVLVFPKPGEMQHRRSSSQAQGYLSPFLLWSHSPAGRPPASGDFPANTKQINHLSLTSPFRWGAEIVSHLLPALGRAAMTASQRPDKNLPSSNASNYPSLKAVQKLLAPTLRSPTACDRHGASKTRQVKNAPESPLPHYSPLQLLWQ